VSLLELAEALEDAGRALRRVLDLAGLEASEPPPEPAASLPPSLPPDQGEPPPKKRRRGGGPLSPEEKERKAAARRDYLRQYRARKAAGKAPEVKSPPAPADAREARPRHDPQAEPHPINHSGTFPGAMRPRDPTPVKPPRVLTPAVTGADADE
jgi:hypothetical protein